MQDVSGALTQHVERHPQSYDRQGLAKESSRQQDEGHSKLKMAIKCTKSCQHVDEYENAKATRNPVCSNMISAFDGFGFASSFKNVVRNFEALLGHGIVQEHVP